MSFARRLVAPSLRTALAARPVSRLALALPTPSAPASAAAARRLAPCLPLAFARAYSAGAGLAKEEITARVLDVLKSFEKVDAGKLSTSSSFTDDLGLDSLDAVEVVMAVEEEFSIEIPDAEADEIKTVQEAIDYIAKTPEAT